MMSITPKMHISPTHHGLLPFLVVEMPPPATLPVQSTTMTQNHQLIFENLCYWTWSRRSNAMVLSGYVL